jgi:SAM-dependent methyltransferase
MNNFEKLYYEDESFWGGQMLQDPLNQERIKKTVELIPQNVETLADIGCGNGVFVNYLNKCNPKLEIWGLDRSETALKYVKTNKQLGDISDIPLMSRSMDCITCLEVIEHLPVPVYEKALSELTRISNKYIIISVPFEERSEEFFNQCPSCKTIFNYELHLRRFDDKRMGSLLDNYGFSCVALEHFGATSKYFGHYTFRKIFYREQFKQWKSPICPVCGYKERNGFHKSRNSEMPKAISSKQKLISYLTAVPKLLWPKVTKDYWVAGLYKKN